MRLSQGDIEAIASAVAPAVAAAVAQRVLELVDGHQNFGLVNAAEVARVLGVDRDWVYEHGERLGAIRLGDGPRPRLRFEVGRAVESFARLSAEAPAVPLGGGLRTPVPRPRRSRGGRR
jgi:hypothetical protein